MHRHDDGLWPWPYFFWHEAKFGLFFFILSNTISVAMRGYFPGNYFSAEVEGEGTLAG